MPTLADGVVFSVYRALNFMSHRSSIKNGRAKLRARFNRFAVIHISVLARFCRIHYEHGRNTFEIKRFIISPALICSAANKFTIG